jgi:hypothetical protein
MDKNRIYVPSSIELRNLVMKEMYDVPYAGHPNYHKMITVVRSQFFWLGIKRMLLIPSLDVWNFTR